MQFVNPGFLYALAAISIPIIIHLFNFRRYRKEYFSNVKLLRELQRKTKRRSRLKHLILLLLRIMAIICIVLAFAQPYIPSPNSMINPEESSSVLIYIDNSFSMQGESVDGVLIEEARDKAIDIAASFKASDKFQLITNDFSGRHRSFVSLEDFTDFADETGISPDFRYLSGVVERSSSQLSESKSYNKLIYLISDFQQVSSDLEKITLDTNQRVFLVPLRPHASENLFIDSCWIEDPIILPGQEVDLFVRVRNNSESDVEKLPLKLNLNQRQRAVASIDIKKNASALANLQFTVHQAGLLQGYVSLNDYPVSFDDTYFVTMRAEPEIDILEVYQEARNPYINALFDNDTGFLLHAVRLNQLDYSSINQYGLLILSHLESIPSGLQNASVEFVRNGGSVLIVPSSEDIALSGYNGLLSDFGLNEFTVLDTAKVKVDYLNLQDPFFDDVFEEVPDNMDLPVSQLHYRQTSRTRISQTPLITLQNGNVFLSGASFEKGDVFVSNVPFDDKSGNFVRHALFVPVMYKIALSAGEQKNLSYDIGKTYEIEIDFSSGGEDDVIRIADANSDFEFIPGLSSKNFRTYVDPHDQIKKAGNFQVLFENKIIDGISFNYNRKESNLEVYDPDRLENKIKELGQPNISVLKNENVSVTKAVTDINKGTRFWKLFIILALTFLAGEIAIIRLWK